MARGLVAKVGGERSLLYLLGRCACAHRHLRESNEAVSGQCGVAAREFALGDAIAGLPALAPRERRDRGAKAGVTQW